MIGVGDEVACVFEGPWQRARGEFATVFPAKGQVLKVLGTEPIRGSILALQFAEFPRKWNAKHFRKVQRRDLQAWLQTAVPAPHLDKRKRVTA